MTTSSLLVPDASVILKWAFRSPDEEDSDKAITLLNKWLAGHCAFVLPSLWVYECGNVLGLKAPNVAKEILDVFLDYHFDECPITTVITASSLRLMREYNVTFYDAVYHAVALADNATLVTADAAYYRKTRKEGGIVLLENIF